MPVMLKMLDLFSGIGGFSLAASWTGQIETVAFCEIEPFCQKVLKKHWPDVPIHSDIKQLRGEDIGPVDIICGGFPCQPFSCAGKQRGKEDDRDLWPEMFRIIQEIRPAWVVGENVANFVNMELDRTLTDLEGISYTSQAFIIPACAVDAPHERKRTVIVAHSNCARLEQQCRPESMEKKLPPPTKRCCAAFPNPDNGSGIMWRDGEFSGSSSVNGSGNNFRKRKAQYVPGERWETESGICRVVDGIPDRVDRLRGLGNSVVPQVFYPIFNAIVQIERGCITG